MPRSKRAQLVHLTQTEKRTTREHKTSYIQEVRDAVDNHEQVYLFSYENMRSNKFKDIRMHFRDNNGEHKPSRILLGKNKLLKIALGKGPEDEYADNLRQVSKQIEGSVGLLFTSRPRKEVEGFFAGFSEPDFARAGFQSPRDVIITNEMLFNHPTSMLEQQFKKLGLPVDIDNGKIVLINSKNEHRLCKKGEELSPEKCKLLTHFGIKLSEFKVHLVCRWSDGEFDMLD
eukprot:CAMPEP_0198118298 /NCGR_PEP_ID=MMETSP1442-20131203/21084_1 /TAXON_ID= /ORGANISM="Craspedostauros australis, Strain CCMP3328" /LENGTH=229 /DNA_ID=CAMNT_0043776527 /DNA_START=128 /DNA_END=817 /DNA_ORIENTATION=+